MTPREALQKREPLPHRPSSIWCVSSPLALVGRRVRTALTCVDAMWCQVVDVLTIIIRVHGPLGLDATSFSTLLQADFPSKWRHQRHNHVLRNVVNVSGPWSCGKTNAIYIFVYIFRSSGFPPRSLRKGQQMNWNILPRGSG
jgi:hypothetical protein